MKHLVIGDAHAKPDVSNRRFDWLGELILEEMPDVIVDIGDFFDMPSLSTYDKGKLSFEGRRYKDDIECGNDALTRIVGPVHKYNNTRARLKKRRYDPQWYSADGNHFGGRIAKAISTSPELAGYLSTDDALYGDYGFKFFPHLSKFFIDDICYSHFIQAGNTDRPVSGLNAARMLLQKTHMSTVVGHSHLLQAQTEINAKGQRLNALVCGCYLDPDQFEEYANQSNGHWWRGINILENVQNGDFDRRELSMKTIQERYS